MGPFPVLLLLVAVLCPFSPAVGNTDKDVSSVSTTLSSIQKEIVDKHNQLRKMVSPSASNMLKMSWSAQAAKNAQNWAERCDYKHSDPEFRKTNMSCGENLFMSSHLTTWSHAIQTWYDEHFDLNFGVGPKTSDAVVGHYTQVVWYASHLVGCGVSYCPKQSLKVFMVCQYCPAGNIYNRLYTPYNKGKPCGTCPNDCDDGLCTNSCPYNNKYSNCNYLKQTASCEHPMVKSNCAASCYCNGKIFNGQITDN